MRPFITHLPALPSSPCLSSYLPLSGLPAAPISPLLVSILIKMSHFAGMALPGQGRPGLLESLPIRVLRHFSKQFTRMLGKQRVLKSTKQPARSSDPSQGAAPCAANASAHGDPEPATAFLQGRTQPSAGDSLAQDIEASDMCRNRNEHVPACSCQPGTRWETPAPPPCTLVWHIHNHLLSPRVGRAGAGGCQL